MQNMERRVAVSFDPNSGTVCLEGEVNIECAAELRSALLAALAAERPATVSLAALTGVDVTAVQLLWAAERQARADGRPLTAADTWPESVRDQLRSAGFRNLPFSTAAA